MSKEKKNVNKEAMQELSENEIEYKKKMSRQTVMTIAMICVSVFVISVATYAWYLISNAPKITGMEFKADTIGDLWIADSTYTQNTAKTLITKIEPDAATWNTSLDLKTSSAKDSGDDSSTKGKGDYGIYQGLSPVTTNNGTDFYRPIYTNNVVTSVKAINAISERTLLNTKYVYEKTFWLRAGDGTNQTGDLKYYNVYLVGNAGETGGAVNFAGSFLRTYNGSATSTTANTVSGAENSLRVSFEFGGSGDGDGHTYIVDYTKTGSDAYTAKQSSLVRIYEPNADIVNAGTDETTTKKATITENGTLYAYDKMPYAAVKQNFDKSFEVATTAAEGTSYAYKNNNVKARSGSQTPNAYDKAGIENKSAILCTIKENEPVKVTMRIWIEGSDSDCVNNIAAQQIAGQIQFVSEENFARYGTRNENESNKVYESTDYFSAVENETTTP